MEITYIDKPLVSIHIILYMDDIGNQTWIVMQLPTNVIVIVTLCFVIMRLQARDFVPVGAFKDTQTFLVSDLCGNQQ